MPSSAWPAQARLGESGVKFDERLLHEGDYHETGGQDALNALWAKNLPFTAVVCANDEMAAGAMAAAHERGLELPKELSIVGFDDAPISRYVYPKLTTIHYPIADMGTMAARWVLKNVYEQPQDVQQAFEPQLVDATPSPRYEVVYRRESRKTSSGRSSRPQPASFPDFPRLTPPAPRAIGTILIIALSGFLAGFDGSLFTGAVLFVKGSSRSTNSKPAGRSRRRLSAPPFPFSSPGRSRIASGGAPCCALPPRCSPARPSSPGGEWPGDVDRRALLSGLGVGAVLVAAPMYIAEISPPALRGRMVTVNQLFLVVGIFWPRQATC